MLPLSHIWTALFHPSSAQEKIGQLAISVGAARLCTYYAPGHGEEDLNIFDKSEYHGHGERRVPLFLG
jgi:hypothetical protein